MDRQQQILINDLLKEREELFAVIYECEKVIENILGQPHPDLPMYPLPSRCKPKKKRKSKAQANKNKPLRRLKKPEENAFALTVVTPEETLYLYQRDHRVIQAMINMALPDYKIMKVETVKFDKNGDVNVVATIYLEES